MSRDEYEYTPGGTLLQLVTLLMVAYAAFAAVGAGSTMLEISLLNRLAAGVEVPQTQLEANDTRQMLLGFLQIGIYIVLGIMFLRLLSRANRNARALGAKGMQFTPGWCIGWFFVPIASVFKPYQAVKEMWQASVPSRGRWQDRSVSPIVGWWWGFWLVALFAGQAAFRLSQRAETLESIRVSSYAGLIANLVDLPLCFVALTMVRQLYVMQEEKRELAASPGFDQRDAESCPSCGERLSPVATACPMCGRESAAEPLFEDEVSGGW